MDGLLLLTAALMGLTLYLVFLWVPTEVNLGVSQRIFYFHVPISMLGLSSIVVPAAASIAYLAAKKNRQRWDSLAYASAEVGLLFATLSLVTGVLWIKPVQGVWWTWELKLTLTLIVWFIYAAYLMLDNYGPQGSQGDRFRAVVAVIGVMAAGMNWVSTKIVDRRAHPDTIVLNMDLDGRDGRRRTPVPGGLHAALRVPAGRPVPTQERGEGHRRVVSPCPVAPPCAAWPRPPPCWACSRRSRSTEARKPW